VIGLIQNRPALNTQRNGYSRL